jgi:hypothetical protein
MVTSVPALFVAEDSPTFMAVRVMFGLILIVLVAYLIAIRPFRSAIARCMGKVSICSCGNGEIIRRAGEADVEARSESRPCRRRL